MVKIPKEYEDGKVVFLGQQISLSKRPLIPRPETEYWVKMVIEELSSKGNNIKCLDLFSGSGCIGISLLGNVSGVSCDFGEIEDNFLEQISDNIQVNGISADRYRIIKTDIFSNILDKYDYILANPPYVAEERINEVGEDVIEYEPHIALFSGTHGMDAINIFLNQAKNYLVEKGIIYLEFDQEQQSWIDESLQRNQYSSWQFYPDQFGQIRFVRIIK
jgi:release factor glutamine methyltransferase